jgi:hypothetical protein
MVKLDRLTREEARRAVAQILDLTHYLREGVRHSHDLLLMFF